MFLETKYPHIYEEYKELYNKLSTRHGEKRNLIKTCTFQNWKDDVESQRAEATDTTTGASASETASKTVQHQQSETASTTSVNEDRVSEDQAVEIIIPSNTHTKANRPRQ